jgi:antitoxin (DNA-binding transcriptional repressor) of toxin-antitoxin stability system
MGGRKVHISIEEAQGILGTLVQRAEDGEHVVLTLGGKPAVRLAPVRGAPSPQDRRSALDRAMAEADRVREPGPSSAELQDSLYDERGLPA